MSSIRRSAMNACRSCSPASRSMCSASLASSALAGWMASPRSRSTQVTGSWASHSMRRPGTRRRSASAMATSRQAWPSPIGELTNRARRSRTRPRVHVWARGRAALHRVTKSRSSRLTRTGSRAVGAWPEPSMRTSSPPVSAAIRSAPSTALMPSWVPWMASTGRRMLRHSASTSSASRRPPASIPCTVAISVSAVVSRPQVTQSSCCLVECGSGNTWAKKNARKPR